jgi:chlorophyll synthase
MGKPENEYPLACVPSKKGLCEFRRSAFTVIELLVAVAILAVLAALFLPAVISRSAGCAALAVLLVAQAAIVLSLPDQAGPDPAGAGPNLSRWVSPNRLGLAFLFLCLDSTLALRLHSLPRFVAGLRNLRWERVLHYAGLCGIGIWLSAPPVYSIVPMLAAVLTVTLAWGAAVVGNDLADINIDRVSNPDRPLVTGIWQRREYARFGWVLLALALAGAWCVGRAFALCILTNVIVAFLYSSPPFRLRRFVLVSSALIGLTSLATAVAGFVCLGARHISDFPPNYAGFIFLGLACGANLKDVKDFEGDRKEGVHTLVTVLGYSRGKIAVGALVAVAMLSAPLLLGKPGLWTPALLWAAAAFYLSTREPFREKRLFLLYYSYVALLLVTGALRPVP